MRLFLSILLLGITACQKVPQVRVFPPDDELISVETYYALSPTLVKEQIQVLDNGLIKYETYYADGVKKSQGKLLSDEKMSELEQLLNSINWNEIAKDDTQGLDGTSVRFVYNSRPYILWTPSYDAEKRGLVSLLNLKKTLRGFLRP